MILFLVYPFNKLIKKQYYIFYSPLGFVGNVRYVYEFFESRGEKVYFITDKELNNGYFSVLGKLFRGKFIILSHGVGCLPLLFLLSKRIQLWHGLPIKKILIDYYGDYGKSKYNLINSILRKLYKLRINFSYNILVTSDSDLGECLSKSMGLPPSRVLKLGTPSIARAYQLSACDSHRSTPANRKFKVLYMPTWRDGSSTVSTILNELQACDSFFETNNIDIYCKLHPLDINFNNKNTISNSIHILKPCEDIIELLSGFDCLLTDYSSVCFEFYPFSKPCVFYVPDLVEYFKRREAYVDIAAFYHGQPSNIGQLKEALLLAREGDWNHVDFRRYCGENKNALQEIHSHFCRKQQDVGVSVIE